MDEFCALHKAKKLCFSKVQAHYFALVTMNEDKAFRAAEFLKKAKFIFNLEKTVSKLCKFHMFCIKKKQLELFSVK